MKLDKFVNKKPFSFPCREFCKVLLCRALPQGGPRRINGKLCSCYCYGTAAQVCLPKHGEPTPFHIGLQQILLSGSGRGRQIDAEKSGHKNSRSCLLLAQLLVPRDTDVKKGKRRTGRKNGVKV